MNVYQKISAVMQEVEYLQKDDTVNAGSRGSYRAISEEKVTSVIRAGLIKYGLVILPTEQKHKRTDVLLRDKEGNEKMSRLATVDVKYRIQNIEDTEDYIEVVSSGTGADTQDKAVGKAMTYAYKYMLLRTFAIPTGEDTDKISSEVYNSQFSANVDFQKKLARLLKEKGIDGKVYAKEHGITKGTTQEEYKRLYEELIV